MSDEAQTIDMSPSDKNSGLPTVYPTLVVGIGGTGVKTLRFLRRRLDDEFGSSVREKTDLVQLLGVDTVPLENRSTVEALHQHEYAYIGGFNASRVIENLDRFKEIKRWWDWDSERGIPLGFISTGAKQLRTIGRLAFYRRFHAYASRLEAKLGRLASIDAHQVSHDLHLRPSQDQIHLPHVFIVASLAGGTGSGAFLDVAAHLRNRLQDQTRIIGVLVMPSVFEEDIPSLLQQRRIRANAYAALKELDYFQSGAEFSTQFPERKPFHLNGGIFTNVFLLDRSNAAGFQLGGQEDVQRLIADAIFEMSVTPTAYHVWEMDANVSREQVDGRSLAYSAMGYSSLTVDGSNRFDWALSEHAVRLHTATFDPAPGDSSRATAAGNIMQQVSDWARIHSRGLTHSKADATTVYQNNMQAGCRNLILDDLRTNLGRWGVDGALEFVNALDHYYTNLLDSPQAAVPSYGQQQERYLEERLKEALQRLQDTQPNLGRRGIDFLSNRKGEDPQDVTRRQQAQAAVDGATDELDSFRLMRRAVAPDLTDLLGRLTNDLNGCRERLVEAWDYDGASPVIARRFEYPLRTFIAFGDNGANGNGAGDDALQDESVIREAAGRLLGRWIVVNGYNPIVQWISGRAEDIRFDVRSSAFDLTRAQAKNRSSLYRLLVSQSRREPERTHDQLRDFIRRCVPYCRLDFDRYNFSEKNIEPTYRICMPAELKQEFEARGSFFWALSTGDYDFQPTDKPGRADRMEALCVSHGYPLSVFADLPDMFNEYISNDLGATPLHLQCCWRFLMPQIHVLSQEEEQFVTEREARFRQLCRDDCRGGSQPTTTRGRRPPPADKPGDEFRRRSG